MSDGGLDGLLRCALPCACRAWNLSPLRLMPGLMPGLWGTWWQGQAPCRHEANLQTCEPSFSGAGLQIQEGACAQRGAVGPPRQHHHGHEVEQPRQLGAGEQRRTLPTIKTLQQGIWRHAWLSRPSPRPHRAGMRCRHPVQVFREAQEGEEGMPAYGVQDIADMLDIPAFDFVKIDIEGAEGMVFEPGNDFSWIGKARAVSLEIHDCERKGREQQGSWACCDDVMHACALRCCVGGSAAAAGLVMWCQHGTNTGSVLAACCRLCRLL